VKHAYTIDDEESFTTARELLKREGIASGSSTGTLLAAALRHCRAQAEPKRVTFVCDTGTRYLSRSTTTRGCSTRACCTGAGGRPARLDLAPRGRRRRRQRGADDVLLTAPAHARGRHLATARARRRPARRLLDESDLLLRIQGDAARYRDAVKSAMSTHVETLAPNAGFTALTATLKQGLVAVIADRDRFYGLITRFDLLNHLRRNLA
jgi:cystathionine beta-synthase